VLVYFGYPQAHEDDARRAVRSGLAIVESVQQGALSAFEFPGTPLAVRVGIATGMMIVGASGVLDAAPALGGGTASSLALRLGTVALPGTVVISEATMVLVSGYFACKALDQAALSGVPALQLVYEVRGESPLQTRLEVEAVRGLTPFVGRAAEVALLQDRWTSVREGLGQMVWIQGEAGIGKSRLVRRVREAVTDELTLLWECRCSPYHQHTALYPLIDLATPRRPRRCWPACYHCPFPRGGMAP
jgi:hypothetical protein